MWVVLFFVAFGFGTGISVHTYVYYVNTPVLFAFESKEVDTRDLPSPTITVSDYSSFKSQVVDKYKT